MYIQINVLLVCTYNNSFIAATQADTCIIRIGDVVGRMSQLHFLQWIPPLGYLVISYITFDETSGAYHW